MSKELLVKTLNDRGLRDLAVRAEKGEFSDFASKHALPLHALVDELKKAGAGDLVRQVRQGAFDHDR